jgi:DNA-binding MarR family transcriptional regulator
MTQKQLSQTLTVLALNMTRLFDGMNDRHLITLVRNEKDRRSQRIGLTPNSQRSSDARTGKQ